MYMTRGQGGEAVIPWQQKLEDHWVKLRMAKTKERKEKSKSTMSEVVTRDYTIHLHKRLHRVGSKKKAPRALKEIRKFAKQQMGTEDVRIDYRLNEQVWHRGIRSVAGRIRVRLARKRNEDEDSPHKLYTLVTYVPVPSFKGLSTENVETSDS